MGIGLGRGRCGESAVRGRKVGAVRGLTRSPRDLARAGEGPARGSVGVRAPNFFKFRCLCKCFRNLRLLLTYISGCDIGSLARIFLKKSTSPFTFPATWVSAYGSGHCRGWGHTYNCFHKWWAGASLRYSLMEAGSCLREVVCTPLPPAFVSCGSSEHPQSED